MKPHQDALFAHFPTLPRMPSWLGLGIHEERELPLTPGEYKATPGDRWTVTLLTIGETIYCASGRWKLSTRQPRSEFWRRRTRPFRRALG